VRDIFCRSLVAQVAQASLVFLTGDLGFKALEPLRDVLAARFINAGVAEQNMVSVAAGLAKLSFRPWVYSIAPFIYARAFEQIRNDVCLHNLPVVFVGNGGGYGYGVMGGTHHALEDYGCLLTLPSLRVFIPAFDEDVAAMVPLLMETQQPAYFRLGLSECPPKFTVPYYRPWRKLLEGNGPTLVASGPIIGGILSAAADLPDSKRPEVWLVGEMPIEPLPQDLVHSIRRSQKLVIVEEHTQVGGLGQMLTLCLAKTGNVPERLSHRFARGYVSGLYGSQRFHRAESGLDVPSIMAAVTDE
jgi:transketolase